MKEVYIAYGNDNEVLYVGQGNTGRHKHCLSGTSHNRDLNRYYFQNSEDGSIRVEVVYTCLSDSEAKSKEYEYIKTLKPLCNVVGVSECGYLSADDVVKYENLIQYYLAKEIPIGLLNTI